MYTLVFLSILLGLSLRKREDKTLYVLYVLIMEESYCQHVSFSPICSLCKLCMFEITLQECEINNSKCLNLTHYFKTTQD